MKKVFTLLMAIIIGHTVFAAGASSGNWRWRNDDGNQTTASWAAGENVPITLSSVSQHLRLRMALYTNDAGATGTFKLQFTTDALTTPPATGSFTTVNNDDNTDVNPGNINWVDVGATNGTNAFIMTASNSSAVTNGIATTQQTTDIGGTVRRDDGTSLVTTNQTTASDPFSAGAVYTTSNGSTTAGAIANNVKTELEFSIKPTANIIKSKTYYFRLLGTNTSNQRQAPGGHLSANTSVSANAGGAYPYLTTSAGILPITLTDFNVVVDANGNEQITWATATESNSANYVIESSIDGTSFSAIATVASKNAATGASYAYSYTKGLPTGINYIRLKAVDKDGSFIYSSTKLVNITSGTSKITIAPNPVINTLNITGVEKGSYVQVYNINAQKILSAVATGASLQQINVSNLSHGAYYVQIVNANKVVANQLIIKQ